MFNQYLCDEKMMPDNMIIFWAHIKTLHEHVLGNANVVIVTLLIASETYLRSHFPTNMIIVKKMAKMQKSEMWNMFVKYNIRKYILIGNQKQLELHVQNLIAVMFNEFMQLFFFMQLMLSSFPRVILEK